MIPLRSGAAQTIIVGPVLDASGAAVTSYSSLSDFRISKNGSTGSFDGSATITHRHNGYYAIALTANDTDTAGWLQITLNHASNTMARVDCYVSQTDLYSAIGYIIDQHNRANLELVGQYSVSSGNTGWVLINGQSGALSPEGFLDGHLMVVSFGGVGGTRQARWIRAHFHSGGDTGFNVDADFTTAPQSGDVLTVYAVTRHTSNVTYWGGTGTSTATVRANLVEILGTETETPGTVGGLALHDDVAAVENTLDTLTEDSGGLRFTAKALEEAPAGSGGGATADELVAAMRPNFGNWLAGEGPPSDADSDAMEITAGLWSSTYGVGYVDGSGPENTGSATPDPPTIGNGRVWRLADHEDNTQFTIRIEADSIPGDVQADFLFESVHIVGPGVDVVLRADEASYFNPGFSGTLCDWAWNAALGLQNGQTYEAVFTLASTGRDGDRYIDALTGEVYGPKRDGEWGGVKTTIAQTVRASIGMATANLDTQLDGIPAAVDAVLSDNHGEGSWEGGEGGGGGATPEEIADAVLSRDVAEVEDSAGRHTLAATILQQTNADTTTTPGKLTVRKTGGGTFAEYDLASDEDADPVTGVS